MLLDLSGLLTLPPFDTLKAIRVHKAKVIERDDVCASAIAHLCAEGVGILLAILIDLDVLKRLEPDPIKRLVISKPDHRALWVIL